MCKGEYFVRWRKHENVHHSEVRQSIESRRNPKGVYLNRCIWGQGRKVNVYPFKLLTSDGSEIVLQGSAVPTICAPLDDHHLCVTELKKRFHLDDYLPEHQAINGEIDMLVGVAIFIGQ